MAVGGPREEEDEEGEHEGSGYILSPVSFLGVGQVSGAAATLRLPHVMRGLQVREGTQLVHARTSCLLGAVPCFCALA